MSAIFRKKNRYIKDETYDPDKIKEADLEGRKVPDFLKQAPWYYNTGKGVEHLRIAPWAKQTESDISQGHKHGETKVEITKWKPGCCRNCGSDQHTEADCTERPRKINAVARGEGIRSKKIVKKEDLSYEAKRDNYANYSNSRWLIDSKQANLYSAKVRAEAAANKDDPDIEIRETYGSTSSRNRQDIAKYIKALGDKKQNPLANGDSPFVPAHDPEMFKKKKLPTKLLTYEIGKDSRKEVVEANEMNQIAESNSREFIERKQMLDKLVEDNTEIEEEAPKSEKYGEIEDVFINGHTSVWGSYYSDGKWGYACCHQMEKNSICTAQRE